MCRVGRGQVFEGTRYGIDGAGPIILSHYSYPLPSKGDVGDAVIPRAGTSLWFRVATELMGPAKTAQGICVLLSQHRFERT